MHSVRSYWTQAHAGVVRGAGEFHTLGMTGPVQRGLSNSVEAEVKKDSTSLAGVNYKLKIKASGFIWNFRLSSLLRVQPVLFFIHLLHLPLRTSLLLLSFYGALAAKNFLR